MAVQSLTHVTIEKKEFLLKHARRQGDVGEDLIVMSYCPAALGQIPAEILQDMISFF